MSTLSFFDSNCMIGRVSFPQKRSFHTVDSLISEMEFAGIDEALVFHSLAKEYHPETGNQILLEEIASYRGLYPMWVLLPEATSEMQSPEETMPEMKRKGVRAAAMFPKDHGFFFDERTCGSILGGLEKEKVPLFLNLDQIDLKDLAVVCEKHPDLSIIITEADWRNNRKLYPILRNFSNLHLEIGRFQAYQGIEEFCEKFGPGRLLFGTHLPYSSSGAAITMVTHADIDTEHRELIAGGNLRRLLGLKSPSVIREGRPCDEIMAALRKAAPLTGPLVIDSHCHMGPVSSFYVSSHDPEEMLGLADKLGIDILCVSHMAAIGPDYKFGNDKIAEGVKRFPDRFFGYAVVNPRYPDDVEPELARCFGDLGMKGIKIHATAHGNYPPDEPGYEPVWQYAEKLSVPVLIDVPEGGYEKLDRVCRKYPMAKILLAHSGGSYKMADQSIELAKKHRNVYLEITYTPRPYGMIEYLVEMIGAERVLYGSDWAYRDPRSQLGWAGYARIPLSDKKKILGGNMAHILNIGGINE
jgi:predicted TIM-barrel fold metal-dependent hydrolase